MKFRKGFLLIILFAFSVGQVYSQMVLLSGPEKGSYSRFADDIPALPGESNISLRNQISNGSASNFKLLAGPTANKAGSLKVVMPLATEQIHLVTKISSGLTSLSELDSKRVGVGNEEQGGFATAKIIKERSQIGWTSDPDLFK